MSAHRPAVSTTRWPRPAFSLGGLANRAHRVFWQAHTPFLPGMLDDRGPSVQIVDYGLIAHALSNAIQKAFVTKLDKLVVTTPGFTWEIAAEVVVQSGKRFVKIFHMQPL